MRIRVRNGDNREPVDEVEELTADTHKDPSVEQDLPTSSVKADAEGCTDQTSDSHEVSARLDSKRTEQLSPKPTETNVKSIDDEGTAATPKPVDHIDWKDRFVRLAADFDNYRKRTAREEQNMKKRERASILRSWLDVLDSTERAIESSGDDESPWHKGLEALHRQMLGILKRHGVQRIDTKGQLFDPRLHEAIAALPVDGFPKGTIIQIDRAGFVFEDGEVLRPARVVVARES